MLSFWFQGGEIEKPLCQGLSEQLYQVGGGTGIRTPGRLITYDCFQDSCNQPLCHSSGVKYRRVREISQTATVF